MTKEARVRDLIGAWSSYRSGFAAPGRWCQLKTDLYQVRNPGFNGSPPLSAWPAHLLDTDPEVLAAVEHYFLTRCWVGNGAYPAWEVRMFCTLYNTGKRLGLSPRHNPANPTTPPSALQEKFQQEGIRDGEADLAASGGSAPLVGRPPMYW